MGQQEFLLQCLDLLGGDAPELTAPDDQQLTLELPLSDDLRLNVSVTWDEPSGRFLASIQSASQETGELPLNEWLLSPTIERASLAARWLQASASPIAPVIAESGILEWQTWLLPNDRGVGGFGEFVAWAMAFHTLFGIEPDQREGALRTLPPQPRRLAGSRQAAQRPVDTWAMGASSGRQSPGQWGVGRPDRTDFQLRLARGRSARHGDCSAAGNGAAPGPARL